MKRALLFWACVSCLCVQAQQSYLEVYGQVQIDINQGNDIIPVNDTTFVIGGEWNGTGYLARVDQHGQLLDYFFLDGTIPGNSRVLDLEQDLAGNVIAAGECDHCASGDSTTRIFAVAVEPSLLFINSAIYSGSMASNKKIADASIARKGNQMVLAASQGGSGQNTTDLRLIGITSNLNVSWSKVYNSCSNCDVNEPLHITTTLNGFGVLVSNANTDSVTLFAVNDTGAVLLKKRLPESDGTKFRGLNYRLGTFYAFGYQTPTGGNQNGVIWRIGETDGSILATFPLAFPSVNDEIVNTRFASDNLLLGLSHREEPNSIGTYTVSGIFKMNAINGTVTGFTEIPNPDVFTSTEAKATIPLNIDGTELAAVGKRGLYPQTFFFSIVGDQPQPPGVAFTATPDTACGPALIFLNNYLTNANSYSWYLDGELFSTELQPAPLQIEDAGLHSIQQVAAVATTNKIQNFIVTSLPEIWNECPICDNKPDPYVVIKTVAGAVLYTSGWVESYPPVALPVSYTMDVNQTYRLEVWDKDNIGADDFFGAFTIEGNSNGGTFSVSNPGDPAHLLTISFNTQLQTQQSTHSQTVLVYRPSANLQGDSILVASPGSPAPPTFTWQWFYNGELIPGATADTFTPTLGGSYVVAMITPGCTALSEAVQFVTPLTGVHVDVVHPKCPGDLNGEIHLQPIGGIGPYTYGWKPPILEGSDPTGLAAGTYNLTLTDANGQQVHTSIVLEDPDSLQLELEAQDLACNNDQSGYIIVNVTGGTGAYTYTWNDPLAQGPNPIYLAAGTYMVTITDQNGCTVVDSTALTEPPPLAMTLSSSPEIATQSPGTATAVPTGGAPPYTYLWSDSLAQTTATATGLSAGTYTVIVFDDNGCPIVDSVMVELVINTRESTLLKDLKLYPIPVHELLKLDGAAQLPGAVKFSLSSASGQQVASWSFESMPHKISLSDLPPGIYFLRIIAADGSRAWKLVKQ